MKRGDEINRRYYLIKQIIQSFMEIKPHPASENMAHWLVIIDRIKLRIIDTIVLLL